MITETEFYQHIGRNVKLYRLQAGMTQRVLAACVDLTRTSVVNIESGLQHPPIYTLYQIAVVLECTLGDLLVEAEESPVSNAALSFMERLNSTPLNARERVLLMAQLMDGK